MIIKVVTLTGDERMIDVEPSDKVLTLKEKLEEREGIPPQQQRLIFQGKQMKDDKTINSYKLKAGTVLHLVVALRDTIYKLWLHQRYENLALTPEIINLLETLRKKYQIALITNGTSAAQWEKIDKLDIREYFDLILVSGDLPYEKPDKNIFFQACEYLNVHPKDCLMVGDKLETDIQGGLEAGLAGTVWIPLTSGYNLVKSDPQPDYIIKHVKELKKVLNGNEDSRWFFDQKPKNLKQFSRVFYLEEDSNSNASDGS